MGRPTGRPPKPLEEKIRTGNPGRRPLPDGGSLTILPTLGETPTPARRLGAPGQELWERVWTSPAGWLARGIDDELILLMCERVDERAKLRFEVLKYGDRLERVALRQLDAQIQSDLIELGFSPCARARIGMSQVKADSSTLDKIAERRATRG